MKPGQDLFFCSMGKKFRITAWFANDDDANAYIENHRDEGVIAATGGLILLANMYDPGK